MIQTQTYDCCWHHRRFGNSNKDLRLILIVLLSSTCILYSFVSFSYFKLHYFGSRPYPHILGSGILCIFIVVSVSIFLGVGGANKIPGSLISSTYVGFSIFTTKCFKACANITRSLLPSQVYPHFEYPAVDGGLATDCLDFGGFQKRGLSCHRDRTHQVATKIQSIIGEHCLACGRERRDISRSMCTSVLRILLHYSIHHKLRQYLFYFLPSIWLWR